MRLCPRSRLSPSALLSRFGQICVDRSWITVNVDHLCVLPNEVDLISLRAAATWPPTSSKSSRYPSRQSLGAKATNTAHDCSHPHAGVDNFILISSANTPSRQLRPTNAFHILRSLRRGLNLSNAPSRHRSSLDRFSGVSGV